MWFRISKQILPRKLYVASDSVETVDGETYESPVEDGLDDWPSNFQHVRLLRVELEDATSESEEIDDSSLMLVREYVIRELVAALQRQYPKSSRQTSLTPDSLQQFMLRTTDAILRKLGHRKYGWLSLRQPIRVWYGGYTPAMYRYRTSLLVNCTPRSL
jgi:hypothetical protein